MKSSNRYAKAYKASRKGAKARMSQISQMLDTLESQANDQPDLAKKNIQKMVDHVAHEGTRDEFARLVKIAERLGLRGLMNRTGEKAAFAAEVVQKLSGGWVIEREGGILYLAKGSEAIPVPSVERAVELHKSYTEGRLMKQNIAGTKSRPFSRSGGKAAMGRTEEEFAEDVQNAAALIASWAKGLQTALGNRDYARAKFVINQIAKNAASLSSELKNPVTRLSRSGRKAAFANWEVTPTKKNGQPIEEHTAKIGGKYFKIDTMPHLGADFGSLYVWDDLRGLKPVASGRIAALKRQAERLGTTNDALSSIILGDFSRAGRKAKMGRTGYEGIPTDTLLGEVDRLARGFYYAKNYATTHNAVASARYRVDMLNEELEKRGISTPKLKRILDSSSYSRTGAKAKFATAGQVADMFKTLSDVERASIKGDTAKMQSLLRSLAPMVDRDRAELPKDAVAYYDEMRRKAGMSRSGGKAAFSDDSEFVLMLGDGWYYTGRNRQHVRSVSKDVVRFPTRQEAEAVAKSMGNRRHTVVDVPKRGAWANIPIQDLLKHDSSRTGEKAAFASANPIANKVAQLMSEGATRDQAVAFAADARKRGEL